MGWRSWVRLWGVKAAAATLAAGFEVVADAALDVTGAGVAVKATVCTAEVEARVDKAADAVDQDAKHAATVESVGAAIVGVFAMYSRDRRGSRYNACSM